MNAKVQVIESLPEIGQLMAAPVVDWNKYIDVWSNTDHFTDPKVIAIDFDETISDNPGTWLQVMKCLERGGYHVVVCTWRAPNTYPQDLQFLVDKGYKIYYTSLRCKKEYMAEQGIDVAIWIDDNPFAILNNAYDYPATPQFK